MTAKREYLVHHGTAGHVGRFRSVNGDCARGDAVVVRSQRGLELGRVLAKAEPDRTPFPDGFVGELLRHASSDDFTLAERGRTTGLELCAAGERLAAASGLPLAVLDAEVLLDGRQAVLHVLKLAACDEGPWLADLGERQGMIVRLHDLGREAPAADDHVDAPTSCGADGCGGGDCGSCGSEGGGCSSCSSGAANELASYFAGLRVQMEERQRVPLL
jgi:hypothetical protein